MNENYHEKPHTPTPSLSFKFAPGCWCDSELEPEPVPDENNWLGMTEDQEVEREDLTNITIDLAGSEEEEEEEVEEMVPEERAQRGTKRSHDFLSTVL